MSKLSELIETYQEIYSQSKQLQDRLSTITYYLMREYAKIENNIFQSFIIHSERPLALARGGYQMRQLYQLMLKRISLFCLIA